MKSASAIRASTRRMKGLIESLLDFAKIGSGAFTIEVEPEMSDTILSEVQNAFESIAAQKAIHIDVDRSPPLRIRCNRERLIQVFSNLIGNAIKFTPEGGGVTIGAEKIGDYVQFRVTDSGPGIPPEHLPHVFDRFWQAKQTARKGTGLGLAIAKGIVEAHHGTIGVESKLGEGATFYFTIPSAA